MKDFQSLPFEKQEEVVRREGLPLRKSHLSTLQASRDRLLRETEELLLRCGFSAYTVFYSRMPHTVPLL